jgi:hypothetical protein
MYPTHRKKVLAEIKSKLKNGETVKIISTQLIEAGVDIDLPVVYREIAGVDSIIQAAGRCNRNGNHQIGNVFVVGQISEHVPDYSNHTLALFCMCNLSPDLLIPERVLKFDPQQKRSQFGDFRFYYNGLRLGLCYQLQQFHGRQQASRYPLRLR